LIDKGVRDDGDTKKRGIKLVGTYVGHKKAVASAAEIDDNAFVTSGLFDFTLRVWNKTTCQCLRSIETPAMYCMIRTKNKSRIVCGMADGAVEIRRRTNGLDLITSFKVHPLGVTCICELEDGSFVSGSTDTTMKRWNGTGEVLQTFSGEHSSSVNRVLELKSGIVVASSADKTMTIWKVSAGQLLQRRTLGSGTAHGLVKLSDDAFVTATWDGTLRVWNGTSEECIETIRAGCDFDAMIRHGDHIIAANKHRMEVWRLK